MFDQIDMWYYAYVGGFFLIAILGLVVQFMCRRKAQKKKAMLRVAYNSEDMDGEKPVFIRMPDNGLYEVNTVHQATPVY